MTSLVIISFAGSVHQTIIPIQASRPRTMKRQECYSPHRTRQAVAAAAPLTDQELQAVTTTFHQYETGLREGTILTKVVNALASKLC